MECYWWRCGTLNYHQKFRLTYTGFYGIVAADKGFEGEQVGAHIPERELPVGERRGVKRFEYISGAAR